MLLKRLHRLFSHDTPLVDHANWLTDRQQIIHILQGFQQKRSLLETRIGDHPETFNTAIIGINPKTGIMALDEITPEAGHELFLRRKTLHLAGRADGVEVECDLQFIAERSQAGIPYYQVDIPKVIIYIQRREIHRVPLNGAPPFRGQLGAYGQRLISGYAADLSLQGIGLVLKELESLHRGDEMTTCMLQIPGNQRLYFSLEVRYVRQIKHRGTTRIGGRFLDLSKKEQNRLMKLIHRLERDHAPLR
ncbi:MAG: flagellar brake protein [Gammaproteobacteria bacterium]|nr:flagellar brake protein [Gammaproteobacteria bacterium]